MKFVQFLKVSISILSLCSQHSFISMGSKFHIRIDSSLPLLEKVQLTDGHACLNEFLLRRFCTLNTDSTGLGHPPRNCCRRTGI